MLIVMALYYYGDTLENERGRGRHRNKERSELKKFTLQRGGGVVVKGVRDVLARGSSEASKGSTLIIGRHLLIPPF